MYNVLLDASGEAKLGVGDMTIHSRIDPQMISMKKDEILNAASMIILDGNLTEEAIHCTLQMCQESKKPLFFEPTDMKKAIKVLGLSAFIFCFKIVMCLYPYQIMTSAHFSSVTYTSPNVYELQTMAQVELTCDATSDLHLYLKNCVKISENLMRSLQVILLTLGDLGVLVIRRGSHSDPLPLENDPVCHEVAPQFSATYYPVPAFLKGGVTCVSGNVYYDFLTCP